MGSELFYIHVHVLRFFREKIYISKVKVWKVAEEKSRRHFSARALGGKRHVKRDEGSLIVHCDHIVNNGQKVAKRTLMLTRNK